MKILRNLFLIFLALSLFSGWGREEGGRLAEASEFAQHSCDHSACQEEIALLEAELAEASRSCSLRLRVEIEFLPGLLGDWAQLEFHSAAIAVSAAAAEGLSLGDDLCQAADSEWNLLACRLIVEELIRDA